MEVLHSFTNHPLLLRWVVGGGRRGYVGEERGWKNGGGGGGEGTKGWAEDEGREGALKEGGRREH